MSTNFQDASGEIRLVGTLNAPDATTGDVLTVNADKTVSPAPGGGSQTLESVVLPIAFDTPGLQIPCSWNIIELDQGTKTFGGVTSNGDGPAVAPGSSLVVIGSTGNDGTYTVVSTSVFEGVRSVIVAEAIPDATVDGSFNETGPAGIKLCDLNVGDLVLPNGSSAAQVLVTTFTTTGISGESLGPFLFVVTNSGRGDMPGTPPGSIGNAGVLTSISDDVAGDGTLLAVAAEAGNNSSSSLVIECAEATSLWIYVATDTAEWPGLTDGEANVRVLIARAS